MPVGPFTQEVRVATTMTGGVSLAIWMGGVAREINVLAQASDRRRAPARTVGELAEPERALRDRYGRLLELLDVVVDVDVLSGTSAGGINAVLLARARAKGLDLGGMRDLWLGLGGLEDLLRDPGDDRVPSLLQGDARLYTELVDALEEMGKRPVRSGDAPSTTLYVTTTLLTGEAGTFTDALGTQVTDLDHRGRFVFDTESLGQDAQKLALALAGRSTSSFPGAFEPSYLPYGSDIPAAAGLPPRPSVAGIADVRRGHWAADGGLLDNQPLDLVLERVFDRPAKRDVRRLLLFVVPTTAQPVVADERWGAPPGLLEALLADLRAVTAQSIVRDLRAIRDHNDAVGARVDARVELADLANRIAGAPGGRARLLTAETYVDYRLAARDRALRRLTAALAHEITQTSPTSGLLAGHPVSLGPGTTVADDCLSSISRQLPVPTREDFPTDVCDLVRLDVAVLAGVKAIALDLAHRAAPLAHADPEREICRQLVESVHHANTGARPHPGEIVAAALRQPYDDLRSAAAAVGSRWTAANLVATSRWLQIGEAVVHRRAVLRQIADGAGPEQLPESRALTTLLDYVGSGGAEEVVLRLVDLAVVEQDLIGGTPGGHQRVELVQVSADTRSHLAKTRPVAARKLTGLQLHHFGAFYKKSWRANDWMWGRIDGAGWLIHVLLDPRRILTVVDRAGPHPDPVTWFAGELARLADDDCPQPVLGELAFLRREVDPPASLPETALWLARSWQRAIAGIELPAIADAVTDRAVWSPTTSRAWAERVQAGTSTIACLLDESPVADETLETDRGSPLLRRTLTKAVATTTAALASLTQLPRALVPGISAIRTVSLGAYRVVNGITGPARWVIGIGLALLVLGVAAAGQESTLFGLGGLAAAAVGGYLVVLGTWQLGRRALGALFGVTIVVLIGALTTPVVRGWLFGGPATGRGWVGDHVGWIGVAWWHPLVALGVIVVFCALLAVAFAPRRSSPSAPPVAHGPSSPNRGAS